MRILTNSDEDLDEMLQNVAFHLGIHTLFCQDKKRKKCISGVCGVGAIITCDFSIYIADYLKYTV